jgi:hypothetical protein
LDAPLPKLCPAVALSHQDGHHSAVVLLLKAALIQVSDYRILGASGFFYLAITITFRPSSVRQHFTFSSSQKPLGHLQPNFGGMVL